MKNFLARFWKCIVAALGVVPAGIFTAYQSENNVTQNEWVTIIIGALGVGYAVWQAPRNKTKEETSSNGVNYPKGEFYSEDTHYKVRDSLESSGLTKDQITDAINQMQNQGILFRERSK